MRQYYCDRLLPLLLPRPRMFIQRNILRNMMKAKMKERSGVTQAMLWLFAYTYLLRVPSEARLMTCSATGAEALYVHRHCRPAWSRIRTKQRVTNNL